MFRINFRNPTWPDPTWPDPTRQDKYPNSIRSEHQIRKAYPTRPEFRAQVGLDNFGSWRALLRSYVSSMIWSSCPLEPCRPRCGTGGLSSAVLRGLQSPMKWRSPANSACAILLAILIAVLISKLTGHLWLVLLVNRLVNKENRKKTGW